MLLVRIEVLGNEASENRNGRLIEILEEIVKNANFWNQGRTEEIKERVLHL